MSSQDITLLLYPVISICGDLVQPHSNMFTIFLLKIDDATIRKRIKDVKESENRTPQKSS